MGGGWWLLVGATLNGQGNTPTCNPREANWYVMHDSAFPFAGDGCSIVSVSYGAQAMHEHSLVKIVCARLAPQGMGGFSSDANWGFWLWKGLRHDKARGSRRERSCCATEPRVGASSR